MTAGVGHWGEALRWTGEALLRTSRANGAMPKDALLRLECRLDHGRGARGAVVCSVYLALSCPHGHASRTEP